MFGVVAQLHRLRRVERAQILQRHLWRAEISEEPARVKRHKGEINNMTTDEKLSFLSGKIDALMHMCNALLVYPPRRDDIIPIIRQLAEPTAEPISNEYEQHYIDGIKAVVAELDALLQTAVSAQQYGLQQRGKKDQTH